MNGAYGVHAVTAAGIIPAALAMREIGQEQCDPRIVFMYLLVAVLIDAIDGPLARSFHVKTYAPSIDGRTIDDLIDYLTFAFIPLMLIWRMDWMPAGWGWTVIIAMMASLFGFAHREAKDEPRGVFRGFPSYWNLYAVYAGALSATISPWLTATLLWVFTCLTVAPVWVVYPNLAPARFKGMIMVGSVVWSGFLIAIIALYPRPPLSIVLISLLYPLLYALVSWVHAKETTRTLVAQLDD
jgi:phosphatidylcholine synthase